MQKYANPCAKTSWTKQLNWPFILFFAATHVFGAAGIYYMAKIHFSWVTVGFAVVWYHLIGFCVTAGYHRLFTHKSYKCARFLQVFFILFGTAAWQHSILVWCSDHRRHHARVDTKDDPHDATRGFWWTHIGWLIFKSKPLDVITVPDLYADWLIRFQHRFYFLLAIGLGFALPVALAFLWSDPIGAFLVAGFLMLAILYHVTFSVNSISHYFGAQPYALTSARTGWITALPTLGEGGDHNFHHAFSWDYRAGGHEWYRIDPTKWILWILSCVDATRNLRRTPPAVIMQAQRQALIQYATASKK